MVNEIIQYVGFQTKASVTAFRAVWTPVALAFKTRGIKTIDLFQFAEGTQVDFLSRNVWNSDAYLQVFPSGLAESAAFGGIQVIQFGGFCANKTKNIDAEMLQILSVLFTQTHPEEENTQIFERVTDRVPYRFAIENFGDEAIQKSKSQGIHLMGNHITRL